MAQKAIVIDWYGPYKDLPYARKAASKDFEAGLYMAIGKTEDKGKKKLQYIGLTKNLSSRITNSHHKLCEITGDFEIWLGEVASVGIPGKKKQVTDTRLDLAEWAHIFFLKLPLNERKRVPPKDTVTVLNRWWFPDYERGRKRRPHTDWPDVIDYWEGGAKIAWFTTGKKCLVWKPGESKTN